MCGCYSEANPEVDSSSEKLIQSGQFNIPSSLDGYTLTMTTHDAKRMILGRAGLENAIQHKFKNYEKYKNRDWSPIGPEGLLSEISFTKNQWKIDKFKSGYTCEKLGENQLLITMKCVEDYSDNDLVGPPYVYEYNHILLTFMSPDAGQAIYSGEECVIGHVQFQLKK